MSSNAKQSGQRRKLKEVVMEEEKEKLFIEHEGVKLPTMYFMDVVRGWQRIRNDKVDRILKAVIVLSAINAIALVALWFIAIGPL